MASSRHIRLIAIATFALFLVFAFYHTKPTYELVATNVADPSGNQLINLNDAKVDDAINNEISKLNQESVDDNDPKDALTKQEPEEEFDAVKELIQIRAMSPMTVFSKTYCPYSKKLKKLLQDSYQITPEPTIVELDKHSHGKLLQEYLGELTGRSTVPNVIVGVSNESKGGADDFIKMHNDGELLQNLRTWGDKNLVVKKINAPLNM